MKLLLDTHALLWALEDDPRLSRAARKHFESAEDIVFSVVSLWEIGIKLGLGKPDFALAPGWWDAIPQGLVAQGVRRLDILGEHCFEVSRLPLHHRDPFDRMLIAQAITGKRSILSCDTKFDDYPVRRVW